MMPAFESKNPNTRHSKDTWQQNLIYTKALDDWNVGPVAQTGLRRRTKKGAQASEAGDPGFKSPRTRQYYENSRK